MKSQAFKILALIIVVALAALAYGNQKGTKPDASREEITALKAQVAELQDKVKKLEVRVDNLLKPKPYLVNKE